MSLSQYVLLLLSALAAGAINSVAGGGTLLTFPVLQTALVAGAGLGVAEAAVMANATSTVALWPGAMAALWGYRREVIASRRWAALLLAPSIVGGWIGAALVTTQRPERFEALVPWLILTAAVLFALQPMITRWTGIGRPHDRPRTATVAGIVAFQFAVAVYGGYFGAGIGILMLAALAIIGLADIHEMNGLKSLLGGTINAVAVAVFVAADQVDWPIASMMAVAAIMGGYGGARLAQRMNRNHVRRLVTAIGFVLAAWYFAQR